MDAKEWYSQVNWEKNPFTLEIYPSLFVGYTKEAGSLISHIEEGHKYILITGPTGSGKTTLLKWLQQKYDVLYLSKPPRSQEELLQVFRVTLLKRNIIDKILMRRISTIHEIPYKFSQKYKKRRILLLIDEAHETNIHILEWLRTLVDQIEGTTLILAGLPILKEKYLKKLETLSQRITLEIELTSLNKDETVQLIKKRIFNVGGRTIEPFTTDAFNEIYNETGGFPREILKLCNTLIHKSIENGSVIVDSSYFNEHKPINVVEQLKITMEELTNKQQKIINLLENSNGMTPIQIVDKLGYKDYGSESHALRGMNNILKRLVNNNLITRERKGRTYIYKISPKLKNILIKS